MARKDGAIKHTAVAPDGSTFKRMSPRTYTHAVLVQEISETIYWDAPSATPADARGVRVYWEEYTSTYDGKFYPTRYTAVRSINPKWFVLSWHQGPANAMKGHAAGLARKAKYHAAVESQDKKYSLCGEWGPVTLVEVTRG